MPTLTLTLTLTLGRLAPPGKKLDIQGLAGGRPGKKLDIQL